MTLSADDDLAAAEFVLGTLDAGERATIAARRLREAELEQAIADWEARLSPLSEAVPEIAAPGDLLGRIEARLFAAGAPTNVVDISRRLTRWRAAAVAASSLAAALVIGIGLRESTRVAAPHEFVAVLQKSADAPAFLVTVNLDDRSLSVRPVAAAAPAGKAYELWIINDKIGAPKSLGVIDANAVTKGPDLTRFDPAVVTNATYAVTVEQPGGSPTGAPTSAPIYVGKLIPTGP
jgi:anti-sigma-K factor RskA